MLTLFTHENTQGLTDDEMEELNDRLLDALLIACPNVADSDDAFNVWLALNPARIAEERRLIVEHVQQFGMW